MRRPLLAAAALAPLAALAQPPAEPGRLPPGLVPPPGYVPAEPPPRPADSRPDPSVKLPQPEKLARIDPDRLTLRQVGASWQLWGGAAMIRDFGGRAREAQEMLGLVRDIGPTQWAAVGSPRPVVDYGLDGGEAVPRRVFGRNQVPVDPKSIRAEAARGAWVVADARNILLNFGPDRAGAEQAAAAVKRYGFNRVALIGSPVPVAAVLFASQAVAQAPESPAAFSALQRVAQEQALTRTGVDVPGLGLVGECLRLDRGQLKVTREVAAWTLAQGGDVLATFGTSEFTARDALRAVHDGRYTEFCRVGGLNFFLTNGKVPARLPFGVTVTPVDPNRLRGDEAAGAWSLCDGAGRPLFPAASQDEAELMRRVARAFGFDALCQVGPSPRNTLRYLAKSGR